MDQPLTIALGDVKGLHFDLVWMQARAAGSPSRATEGVLRAWIGERLVWGTLKRDTVVGIRWTWIELLEHLSRVWPRLELEEVPPLDIDVWDPALLRMQAEARWLDMPENLREAEQADLWAFEDAHDLSRALQGAWPEPLWLLRGGSEMWVSSRDLRIRQSATIVLDTLSKLGNAIAERLRDIDDPRAEFAIERWIARGVRPLDDLLSFSTGLRPEAIRAISAGRPLGEVWALDAAGFRVNELQAVARMAGPSLSAETFRAILDRVRHLPHRVTPALDRYAEEAKETIDHGRAPYEQGHALAAWFGDRLGLAAPTGFVNVEEVLSNWGVEVATAVLSDESLDAIACWGPEHGPAIVINEAGRHSKDAGGRRATLAHEIAHLLLDRSSALPLAEVRGGRVPTYVEARANAFAAELLLPRAVAGRTLAATDRLDRTVRELCERYGVSRELVAWQARNSSVDLPDETFRYLRSLVGDPRSFVRSP